MQIVNYQNLNKVAHKLLCKERKTKYTSGCNVQDLGLVKFFFMFCYDILTGCVFLDMTSHFLFESLCKKKFFHFTPNLSDLL